MTLLSFEHLSRSPLNHTYGGDNSNEGTDNANGTDYLGFCGCRCRGYDHTRTTLGRRSIKAGR